MSDATLCYTLTKTHGPEAGKVEKVNITISTRAGLHEVRRLRSNGGVHPTYMVDVNTIKFFSPQLSLPLQG